MGVPGSAPHTASSGLLGDSTSRDYSAKLSRFNLFAEPEIRLLIQSLELKAGMHVLDAGCGTGEALSWLADEVGPCAAARSMPITRPHG